MAKVAICHAILQVGDVKYRVNTFPACKPEKPGYVMAELPFGQSVYGESYDVEVAEDGTFLIRAKGHLYITEARPTLFEVFGNSNEVGVNLLDEERDVYPVFAATKIIPGRINIKK